MTKIASPVSKLSGWAFQTGILNKNCNPWQLTTPSHLLFNFKEIKDFPCIFLEKWFPWEIDFLHLVSRGSFCLLALRGQISVRPLVRTVAVAVLVASLLGFPHNCCKDLFTIAAKIYSQFSAKIFSQSLQRFSYNLLPQIQMEFLFLSFKPNFMDCWFLEMKCCR